MRESLQDGKAGLTSESQLRQRTPLVEQKDGNDRSPASAEKGCDQAQCPHSKNTEHTRDTVDTALLTGLGTTPRGRAQATAHPSPTPR